MTLKPHPLSLLLAVLLAGGCAKHAVPSAQKAYSEADSDQLAAQQSGKKDEAPVALGRATESEALDAVTVTGTRIRSADQETAQPMLQIAQEEIAVAGRLDAPVNAPAPASPQASLDKAAISLPVNSENYAETLPNPVKQAALEPVSTFSIDVDTGAFSNARRMLLQGSLPPADAVRAEEFVNYFDYGYTPPSSRKTPFSVTTELAPAPWNAKHQLLMVGLQGYEVPKSEIPAANLVFLIDVSGSMDTPNRLPLVLQSMAMLVAQLRAEDRVSIVVYAGAAGAVLEPTPGDQKEVILEALQRLKAGGSTNGGDGIELAYRFAERSLIKGGVNRIILATDGDFNVGTVGINELKDFVASKRDSGVSLSTLGYGQGNYNDEMAEQLADVGNGNHAYIDTLREAQKVLVDEMSSTLFTIAKDVKIQIEFNPSVVAEYRLIGYENRMLRREDFNNDAIDAGEIGAGHTVTALYELALTGSGGESMDPLRYGEKTIAAAKGGGGSELAFLKLRYKLPNSDTSTLIKQAITGNAKGGERLNFAAAVAGFAEKLRGGSYLQGFRYQDLAQLARKAEGRDPNGRRRELVELIQRAGELQGEVSGAQVSIAE